MKVSTRKRGVSYLKDNNFVISRFVVIVTYSMWTFAKVCALHCLLIEKRTT